MTPSQSLSGVSQTFTAERFFVRRKQVLRCDTVIVCTVNEFHSCPEQCECAYVREILQVLENGTGADLQFD